MIARLMLNLREFTAVPDEPLPGTAKQKVGMIMPVVFRTYGDRNTDTAFEDEEDSEEGDKSESESEHHIRLSVDTESTPSHDHEDGYRSQWYPTVLSSAASLTTSRWERNRRSPGPDAIELSAM
ncbi:hypothetical protein H0H93_015476 [Arthromyces matolae]|nr:hypothetical protein H0H93_015476 [Arthromyces matolae]